MMQTSIFRVHNTYDVPLDDAELFRERCAQANFKPIILYYNDSRRTDEYIAERVLTTDDFAAAKQTALELASALTFSCFRTRVKLLTRPDNYPDHFDDEVLYYELQTTRSVVRRYFDTSVADKPLDSPPVYTYRTRTRATANKFFRLMNGFCEFELTLYDSNPDFDYEWCPY